MSLFGKKKSVPEDGQMELIEHLAELRTRLFRSIFYLLIGMVVTYGFFKPLYNLVSYPLTRALAQQGVTGIIKLDSVQDAFFLKLQVSFFAGLAIALPLVVLEIWGFIRPALTDKEREPAKFLAPFSTLLFLTGVGTGYAVLPLAYDWMAGYIGEVPDAQLVQDATKYLLLSVRIILAFGIAFQLPVILLFLARVGILSAKIMTTYWRHAVVIIATLAAVFVPSNDPITMIMMAMPMAGLYLLSISLVKAFEPKEDGTPSKPLVTMILVSLAPAIMLAAVSFWILRQRQTPIHRPVSNSTTVVAPAPLTPDNEKRLKTLEEKVAAQEEALKKQTEELTALKEALTKLTPAPTPTPEPTPGPTNANPNGPVDGR